MNGTPRTDSAILFGKGVDKDTSAKYVTADFCRQLERELAACRRELERLTLRNAKLEADEARIDWMQSLTWIHLWESKNETRKTFNFACKTKPPAEQADIREAIDAAKAMQ